MRRLTLALLLFWAATTAANAQGGEPALIIESGGHSRSVRMVAFTPDGEKIVSVGDDNAIRVWSKDKRRLLKVISCRAGGRVRAPRSIRAAALSPDGKLVAVGGDFKDTPGERFAVHLYDLESGRQSAILRRHTDAVTALAFSRDGRLASGSAASDRRILVWDVAAAAGASSAGPAAPVEIPNAHEIKVTSLAFSPADPKLLASGGDDQMVKLWDWPNRASARVLRRAHTGQVRKVAFSPPDGRYLVSGGLDRKILFWEMRPAAAGRASGFPSFPLPGIFGLGTEGIAMRLNLRGGVQDFSFTPDGATLLVGERRGGCELFAVPEVKPLAPCAREDNVTAVAFAPDGKEFVTSGGFNGELYLEEGEEKRCVPGGGGEPAGKRCRQLAGRGQTVWSVGFSADGGSIAFGTRRAAEDPKGYGPLEQVFTLKDGGAYSPSLGGAPGAETKYIRSVLKSGRYELRTRFGQQVGGERMVYDDQLQVLKDGKPHQTIDLSEANGEAHKSFTLTGDGRVISGAEDGYLRMYNPETGAQEMEFQGHTGDVWAVAVSPDNRLLASGSSDQTVRLWDIRTGTNLLTVFVSQDYEWFASTPEGYYAASLSGDRHLGWVYTAPGEQSPQFYRASQFQRVYYRPEVVAEYLKTPEYLEFPDIGIALDKANAAAGIRVVTSAGTGDPLSGMGDPVKLAEALPPRVRIEAREAAGAGVTLETTSPVFTLKFTVESPEKLPITDVGIFLNGVRQTSLKGVARVTGRPTSQTFEVPVPLAHAENTLSVVASNARATSSPEVLRVFYKPVPGILRQQQQRQVPPAPRPRSALPVVFRAASFPAPPRPAQTPEVQTVVVSPVPETVEEQELRIDLRVDFKKPCPVPGEKCHVVKATLDGVEVRRDTFGRDVEEYQLVVPLSNEETPNTLRVVASNGESESRPLEWTFNFRPRIAAKPNLIFLGIGIQKFESFQPPLNWARRDAEEMEAYMKTQGENGPHGAKALYKEVFTKLLRDEEARIRDITDALNWVNEKTRHENDVRVVLISTHGGAPAQGGTYYLYSYNHEKAYVSTTSLGLVELWTTLASHKGKTILLIDACRDEGAKIGDIAQYVRHANAHHNIEGRLIVFLASANKPSIEKNELQHGVFTYVILRGLREEAAKVDSPYDEADKDSLIQVEELRGWVTPQVLKRTSNLQSPYLWTPETFVNYPLYVYRSAP